MPKLDCSPRQLGKTNTIKLQEDKPVASQWTCYRASCYNDHLFILSFIQTLNRSLDHFIFLPFDHSFDHLFIHPLITSISQYRKRANTSREAVAAEPPFPWCPAWNQQSWRAPRLELESYHMGSHWKKRICLLSVKQAQRTFGRGPISRFPLAEKITLLI